jgi:hypothetical protein
VVEGTDAVGAEDAFIPWNCQGGSGYWLVLVGCLFQAPFELTYQARERERFETANLRW